LLTIEAVANIDGKFLVHDDDDISALSEDRSWRWLFVLRITTHDLTTDRLGQMSTGGRPKVLPVQAMGREQLAQVCS